MAMKKHFGTFSPGPGHGRGESGLDYLLAMGVFSPVVDYLVATQFRGQQMGWPPNMDATRRMLSAFGYSKNDLPYGGQIFQL